MRNILIMLSIALLALTSSCLDKFGVKGNRIVQTEQRTTTNFDEVTSSGSFDVYLMPGDEPSIEVTAESNLLPYIETDIDGDRLKIRTRGANFLINHDPMEIYITSPNVNKIQLSGSGFIETGNFQSDQFEISLSGSGTIRTSVEANDLDMSISGSGKILVDGYSRNSNINISGSGRIEAYDLSLEYCDVRISGSGDTYLNVEKNLDVSISGSGNVHFINSPSITSHISGSGKIINNN